MLSFFVGLLGLCLSSFSQAQEIIIKNLHGNEISAYTKEISTFYNTIYREAPYFYDSSQAAWDKYIQSYADENDATACLALQDKKIIGIAIGTPLDKASKKYNAAFSNRPDDLYSLYYLGELAVKAEYRDLGTGKKMYQAFEELVREKKHFSGICLWQLQSEENSPTGLFWKELGFALQPDIHFDELWKDVSGTEKVAHRMICWKKPLTTAVLKN